MKEKADEQLNEAYSRSVIVTSSEIIIRPTVQGKFCWRVVLIVLTTPQSELPKLSSHFLRSLDRYPPRTCRPS